MELIDEIRQKEKKTAVDPLIGLKQDVGRVAQTESGLRLLRYLMDECGFHLSSVVKDRQSGEINLNGTVWNEGRRSLWLELRRLIPAERLTLVEQETEKEQ